LSNLSSTERCNVSYRIGHWTIDPGCQRARRGSEERLLEAKELAVLLLLIEGAPAFLSVEDLLNRAWPNTVVGSNALHQAIRRLRKTLEDDPAHPRLIETLAKRGYRLAVPVSRLTQHLAVVVVEPVSALDGEPWFSDALRDEVVCRLSKMARLRILLEDSEGSSRNAPGATRLTGTTRMLSDRMIRVCMQLSGAGTGDVLWADTFDVNRADRAEGPGAVAEQVGRALRVFLSERSFGAIGTHGGEAVHAHLKGAIEIGKAHPDGFDRAIGFFNQAIALNPDMAAAWIGKAEAFLLYSNYGRMERRKAWEAVRTFAHRALALDPQLPSAHLMMADLDLYDGKFESAHQRMSEFQRFHGDYQNVRIVQHLSICGCQQEALDVAERMIELDSGGMWPRYLRIMTLWLARRYGEALHHADAILAVTPHEQRALGERSRVLGSMGRLEESVACRVTHGDEFRQAFQAGGEVAYLQEMLDFAGRIERGETRLHPEYAWRYYVEAYAALGQREKALQWLARGYEVDPWEFLWWRQMPHPGMAEVRQHPSFKALMARTVGFPASCPAADGA
jgi:DNA-binding winged helix-turn-helix (wHTH) protein